MECSTRRKPLTHMFGARRLYGGDHHPGLHVRSFLISVRVNLRSAVAITLSAAESRNNESTTPRSSRRFSASSRPCIRGRATRPEFNHVVTYYGFWATFAREMHDRARGFVTRQKNYSLHC